MNGELIVNISNLTTITVTIPSRAMLAKVKPVKLDESVFENLQDEVEFDLLKKVNSESDLTPEQNK